MHLALVALALQLRTTMLGDGTQRTETASTADSARDLRRARNAQASFESSRRNLLPYGTSSGGRCDVRLGRFCWWYDESMPTFPPEGETIRHRRSELLAHLDRSAARYPGDDWIVGMRVYYRIDGRDLASADSVAHACTATSWWCSALIGYAAHAKGEESRADSAFSSAVAAMPHDARCAWLDITVLLHDADRGSYEHRLCDDRPELEMRYWLLSRPQFASGANEWRNEFHTRRVLTRLGERAATPHLLSWGRDAAELVLRYGWPTAWSRVATSSVGATDPGVIGHDPSPSFAFAPARWLSDSLHALRADAWNPSDVHAEARYAPRLIRRIATVAAQFARFRRGDSTLIVAAFAATDDSLRTPIATLGAAAATGMTVVSPPDTGRSGTARVTMSGFPWITGVDIADTITRTLARVRLGFLPAADSARLSLSDLLFYRAGEEPATSLDAALARAIRGDTVTRNKAVGMFWETYGIVTEGEPMDLAVSVERVDHGWIRSARQKLGLTPIDTPIRMRWTDARPPTDRAVSQAIALDLANLDSGRYRVTLTLTPATGRPVAATREVELIDP